MSDDAIHSAEAQVAKAKAELDKAQDDLNRRQQLSATGAISKEELSTAQAALNNAQTQNWSRWIDPPDFMDWGITAHARSGAWTRLV